MTDTPLILIQVSLWDSGCLPWLLQKRIEEVEEHMRRFEAARTDEANRGLAAYLAQLKACLAAVEAARNA